MKHLITISLLLFSFCSFGQNEKLGKLGSSAINPLRGLTDYVDSVYRSKCKHIYVAVEQPEVNGGFSTLSIGKFGKHEGKEIVCIKCHHLRKQIVDYGQAGQLQLGDIVLPKEH